MRRGALIGPAVLASVVTAFVAPAAATAAGGPAAGYQPGIAEYEETLPSAGGGIVSGSTFASHALAPQIQAKLKRQGGTLGASLKLIATSATFGAPQTTPSASYPGPAPADTQPDGAVASAVDAVRGGVLALVLALLALTVGAAAALPALRRRAGTA